MDESCEIAVVIPTYNRVSALRTCLEHLERQTWRDFEVVVVDDGSTDGTAEAMEEYGARTSLRMRFVRQENRGPARARNVAIGMVRAPVCLMIGDDIFGAPELVATHVRFHREHPEERMAGLGWTRWSETGQVVTPFMRWLEGTDLQFSYAKMLAGKRPGWGEFFTSNLSVKTELLRSNPFDERFRAAAMEDIELGYRLERQGKLELVFMREALAWHVHPTTFLQACGRLEAVGAATYVFHHVWPEQRGLVPGGPRRWLADQFYGNAWMLSLLREVTAWVTERRCPNPLLEPVLRFHSSRGYRNAARQE